MIKVENKKRIHFIGIGGISMSGLARIMISRGYTVTGSDLKGSNITDNLRKLGAIIYEGHSKSNINLADLVVYTAAISKDNEEYQEAVRLGIPMLERSEFLGQIMKSYRYSINIAGTHGKTTTTSMISAITLHANLNPTIHVGGELDLIGGNTLVGGEEYFITEACEYVDSFLKFHPYTALVLNIEEDHLDYFSGIEQIKDSFYKFISLVPEDGYIVGYLDDENVEEILNKEVRCKNVITYAIDNKKAKWRAINIAFDKNGHGSFDVVNNNEFCCRITLNVPGIHNIKNALAAAVACLEMGISSDDIVEALKTFTGAHRRFEFKGEKNNVKVVDDYAHHPSEIKTTLKAAKNGNYNKVWCIFQPHTYTRTKTLFSEFLEAFYDADNIIITDIYAAREKDTGIVNSNMLAQGLHEKGVNAIYIKRFEDIVKYLKENVKENDLVLTMGAGDVYKIADMYLEK